ncbi:MAG: type II toxin-antitoxin system ParD family antitoxin [Rhizobiaceae bacterium]|nr:type II toxin-antitoxin system ParD family antitoxin [Rhizobiaceae bacterium]
MATMTISLPEKMKEWVEDQLEAGYFASSSDYVRDLIRRDREKREAERDKEERMEELRRIIDEGWESGISTMSLEDRLARAKTIARERGILRD